MRYVKYELVMMPVTAMKPDGTLENKIAPYGLNHWHFEQVWPMPCWRDDEVMMGTYMRLQPKLKQAAQLKDAEYAKGVDNELYVPVDDKDYEKWCPVVTKKGEKLPQGAAEVLMQLLQHVMFAPSEAPKGARVLGEAGVVVEVAQGN
jgi:hypothetical protein